MDKNGQTVTTTYNALSLPLYVSAGNLSRSFTYDQAGRRLSMTDESGTSNYTYDSFGQLITETDGNGGVKTYTYDDNGNRLTFTLTVNGTQLISAAYEYDKLNRLTKVTLDGDTTTYTYDENGNVLNTTTGDLVSQYTYNDAGLVTGLSNQQGGNPISTYSYQYYADGNQKSKTENGVLTSYEYDTLRRLTKESSGSDVTTYSFDPYGNRASMQTTGSQAATVTYTYNAKNQLLTESKNVGGTTEVTNYVYDNNGNLTSKTIDGTGTLYEYNAFNQLAHSTRGIYNTYYTYNGDGLRMKKCTNGVDIVHYWDGDDIVAEKMGVKTSVFARGLSLISYKFSSQKGYYVQNGHGDITKIVTASGTVRADYEYDAYGNHEEILNQYKNPFRYCGEYWDEETENIYLRARYYDSSTGRFISEDTHWNVNNMIYGDNGGNGFPNIAAILQSSNLYAYCGSNPILRIDPTGKTWEGFDSFLPQWAQTELARLTVEYINAGDSLNENGGFVRDDIHNQAMNIRNQFIDYTYLNYAIKDFNTLGITESNYLDMLGLWDEDITYAQAVHTYAMELQHSSSTKHMVRNPDGSLSDEWIRAVRILGGTDGRPGNNQAQNRQTREAANKYNLSKEGRELLHRNMGKLENPGYQDALDEAAAIAALGGKYVK